jgi:Kef-type K+ transport system membrane component KefB
VRSAARRRDIGALVVRDLVGLAVLAVVAVVVRRDGSQPGSTGRRLVAGVGAVWIVVPGLVVVAVVADAGVRPATTR